MTQEQWRPIEEYEGLYEVSNMGRVKSLERIDKNNHLVKGKILKPVMMKNGYLRVDLSKEGKHKMFSVHRLVGMTFIPNPEGLPQINHIDEDKTNNRVDNLEWCDCKYNINYGAHNENIIHTKIKNGTANPDMCGIGDEKEYNRLYCQNNREKKLEYQREYRRRKKQVV